MAASITWCVQQRDLQMVSECFWYRRAPEEHLAFLQVLLDTEGIDAWDQVTRAASM